MKKFIGSLIFVCVATTLIDKTIGGLMRSVEKHNEDQKVCNNDVIETYFVD